MEWPPMKHISCQDTQVIGLHIIVEIKLKIVPCV